MSGIYCSLEEAYGTDFNFKPKPKPSLLTLKKKINNNFNEFKQGYEPNQLREFKPNKSLKQRKRPKNNFEIDNLETKLSYQSFNDNNYGINNDNNNNVDSDDNNYNYNKYYYENL